MHSSDIAAGERFEFGRNWLRFLRTLDEAKIERAKQALEQMLGDVRDKSFLDVGCGSGLSSLAAHRAGAKVRSFDYDMQSVACTREVERRYRSAWRTEQGSALDPSYLGSLGTFDIVYSWGVLHHTGDMWQALDNMSALVRPGGILFLSIYNDQGWKSAAWRTVKRAYNRHPTVRVALLATCAPLITAARFISRALRGRPEDERGMSLWHDAVDWLGGYPFEVARPEAVVSFFQARGFTPEKVCLVGKRSGCNEFVLRQGASP